jgi:hypothetical protein
MACEYCAPNKKGQRNPMDIQKYYLRGSLSRYKRNVLKIYRGRNRKKKYFIGVHSKDLSDDGTMFRNNGFQNAQEINFCPMCGQNLKG